jgi:hypothetical protein
VLLQEELPLQAVLMAASMSRVHTLPLPSGGQLLVEVALSHPRQGGMLLAALGGGSGLRVVDHEEGGVMRVAVGSAAAALQRRCSAAAEPAALLFKGHGGGARHCIPPNLQLQQVPATCLQAVRIGPQRTAQEAKRRNSQGAGASSWVATG